MKDRDNNEQFNEPNINENDYDRTVIINESRANGERNTAEEFNMYNNNYDRQDSQYGTSYDFNGNGAYNQGQSSYGNGAVNNGQPKKSGRFGVGALIATAAASIAVCALICVGLFGIMNSKLDRGSNNATAGGETKETSPASSEPNSTASNGLIIGDKTSSASDSADNILDTCRRSVVSINVQTVSNSYYYGENVATSAGSGVILTSDGYIVTCNHVVEGATSISVALQDGTTYDAKTVGYDSRTDLAVIKIDETGLPAAILGDSNSYKVGDRIYAIGNPLGEFASTVTDGIISGIDRSVEIDGTSMTLMQTNAAINPGNSGGGLFSAETGELVGIVNAKNYGLEIEGLGFAIPTSSASDIIKDLMDLGYVTGRPYIGISMQLVSTSGGFGMFGMQSTKVKITAVSENSPAAKAGVKANDIIVSFGGASISTTDDLSNVLNNYNAGDSVKMVVERNAKQVELTIELGEASGK